MRLLLFNLATDTEDPILGFTTRWIHMLAKEVEWIHIITMRAGRIKVPSNVQVYSVGKEKGCNKPRRVLEFYRHLFRILQEGKIDVCFSHMIPSFTVLAAPVLKVKGIPIVTWYAHPSLSWILKLAHYLSDRMVASITTAYPYKRDKLVVVGQGIDTNLFAPNETAPEDPPVILCVGRLSPVKNHPTLLKAIALLQEQWKPPVRAVIIGGPAGPQDESYVQSLHQQVQVLGLQYGVHFEQPISMSALPSQYRRCTVHVNLTPTGFGDKVAWEAMACGRPCLVANEGLGETLEKYADRLLFRYEDPTDLANKLIALLTLAQRDRDKIGLYLRQQVVRLHSLDSLSSNLMRVFQMVKQC